jgi:hypothetical protein
VKDISQCKRNCKVHNIQGKKEQQYNLHRFQKSYE